MTGELLQLGIDLRVIPIGLNHPGLQIINDHRGRDAAKMPERIFQTPDKALAGLPPHDLAVTLARMTQYPAEQMRTPPLTFRHYPPSLPEIHLQLLAWQARHPPERRLGLLRQTTREAFDRVIRAGELVLRHQILVDALRRKPG